MPPRSRARAASNASPPAPAAADTKAEEDALAISKAAATTLAMSNGPALKPTSALPPLLSSTAVKIPAAFRFPALVFISYAFGLVAHPLAELAVSGEQLRAISRHVESPWLIAAALGWRVAELAVGWFADLDGIASIPPPSEKVKLTGVHKANDALFLTLLTHLPQAFLLHTFYLVPLSSTVVNLAISSLSTYVPFRLFLHRPDQKPYGLTSAFLPLQVYTTLLASAIYALILLLSLSTWLPTYLIVHFDGLRTVAPAHSAALPTLVLLMLPTGFVASRFLFDPLASPALAAAEALIKQTGPADSLETQGTSFDPATATLAETVAWNVLWWRRYSPRGRELLRRMLLLVAGTGACAGIKAWAEVGGVEAAGAAGWAVVWMAGAGAAGAVLGWVGDAW